MKKVHYYSGVFLSLFIILHFTNHLFALVSPAKHIMVMDTIRPLYRNILIEPLLFLSCLVQIVAGLNLAKHQRKNLVDPFDRLHLYSGLYLAFFLLIHPTAILVGRYVLKVDTSFWYGAMGLNIFPFTLFFVPYYFLGVFAFFAHLACIHRKRVTELQWSVNPDRSAKIILGAGFVIGLLILAGLTGFFQGLEVPDAYQELLPKFSE
ncbi:MAG: hypothetical protein AAGJ18_19245 [Bacteroidota bacterium]